MLFRSRMASLERALLSPETLLSGLTQAGLGALSLAYRPGDYFTLDLDDPSLAGADTESLPASVIFSANRTGVRDVFVDGKRVVESGRHPLQDEIVREFTAVLRRST